MWKSCLKPFRLSAEIQNQTLGSSHFEIRTPASFLHWTAKGLCGGQRAQLGVANTTGEREKNYETKYCNKVKK